MSKRFGFSVIVYIFLFVQVAQGTVRIQLLSNDPGESSYRGLQMGIRANIGSDSEWLGKARFADKEDRICRQNSSFGRKMFAACALGGLGALKADVLPFLSFVDSFYVRMAAAGLGVVSPFASDLRDGLGYWSSKVNVTVSQGLSDHDDDHLRVRSDGKYKEQDLLSKHDKVVLFEWQRDGTVTPKGFLAAINRLRRTSGGPFPYYTLAGIGGWKDGINCVSFCVRLGKELGIPFGRDDTLSFYTKGERARLPFSRRAAKVERIAEAILNNSRWKNGKDGFFVRKDHPFWISSGLEELVSQHPRKR